MGTKTRNLGNLQFEKVNNVIVEWQSVIVADGSTNTQAVAGRGYFIDTSSAAHTIVFPQNPTVGDVIQIADYAGTFGTNNVTIDRNGEKIQGSTGNGVIETDRKSVQFIYVDTTKGWIPSLDAATSIYGLQYVAATGGTVTTSGAFKIHSFTGDGCFVVSCAGNSAGSNTVDYLVVAGGGGGGTSHGGGGGAGGYRESSGAASGCYTVSPLGACVAALPVSEQTYPVTVGGGGSAGPSSTAGSNSVFSTITSAGGGRGGSNEDPAPAKFLGGAGGSGGGSKNCHAVGAGNTPPVSPPQGNNGGSGAGRPGAGGGGGATAAGAAAASHPNTQGAPGGAGATSCITGSPVGRAGGGAGQCGGTPFSSPTGAQPFGGGNANYPDSNNAGDANTGGGGGGNTYSTAGTGGKGIVIIRYKFQTG